MKIIAFIVNLVFSVSSIAGIRTTAPISPDGFTSQKDFEVQQVRKLHNYYTNDIAAKIPAFNKQQLQALPKGIEDLIAKMKKHNFDADRIKDMENFKQEVIDGLTIQQNIESCQLDPEYDLTKNDLATFTNSSLLGELSTSLKCRSLVNDVFSFPEVNSIKDVMSEVAQNTMATEVHRKLLDNHVSYYFDVVQRYAKDYPSLEELQEKLCEDESEYCKEIVKAELDKRKTEKKTLVNFSSLTDREKREMVHNVNSAVTTLNQKIKELREVAKKNPSLLTIGGNDFVISCDPNSEDKRLLSEYQDVVDSLIVPKSRNDDDIIRAELIVTMLYDDIGMPASLETPCDEEKGYHEITLQKEQHKTIDVDTINDAAENVETNARNIITSEIDDYDKNSDAIDYIGTRSAYAPHQVGDYLAKNPESVAMVCEGLKDFNFDEDLKKTSKKVLNGMLLVAGVVSGAGLIMLGARGGLALAGKIGSEQMATRIGASSVNAFATRGSQVLLNSKTSLASFGALSVGEIALTQKFQRESNERMKALEAKFLALPDSETKRKLLEEYNKFRELDFDLTLAWGLGMFDIVGAASLVGLAKSEKALSQTEADELFKFFQEKNTQITKMKEDPNYDPMEALQALLPKFEYERLMKELQRLNPKEMDEFNETLRTSVKVENDFEKGLKLALKQTKAKTGKKIKAPKGKELNRRMLASLSRKDKTALKLRVEKDYADIIKAKGFDGPEYAEDMASIIYLLEKTNFKNRNLPKAEKKKIIDEKLDELTAKYCKKP